MELINLLNGIKRISQLRNNTGVFIYQAAIITSQIVTLKLVTSELTIDDFGYYSLINSLIALYLSMPYTAFLQGLNRYIYNTETPFKIRLLIIMKLLMASISISFLIYSFFEFFYDNVDYLILILILIQMELVKALLTSSNNILKKRPLVVIGYIFETLIRLIWIVSYELNINHIFLVLIFSTLVNIIIMSLSPIEESEKWNVDKKLYIKILSYSSPFLIWNIFTWLKDMGPRWNINSNIDIESTGAFTVIVTVSMLLPQGILNFFNALYTPKIFQDDIKGVKLKKYVNRILKNYIYLSVLIIIFSLLFSEYMVIIFSDEKYIGFSNLIPYMSISFIFLNLGLISSYIFMGEEKTNYLIVPNIFIGLLTFTSTYFVSKYYNLSFVIYTIVIVNFLYLLLIRFKLKEI